MVQILRTWHRLILVGFSFSLLDAKLVNLSDAKAEVEAYYESGQYTQEVESVINKAIKYFADLACPSAQTIVMDIDDTALSTFDVAKSTHYGHVAEITLEAERGAELPAIPAVKRLYDFLKQRGFHIIFITGRKVKEYASTKHNLIDQGFTGFDQLIMRTPAEEKLTAQVYKAQRRKRLTESGVIIAGTIGDQYSDLRGGYAGHAVKLPNYLYRLV